MIDLSKLKLGDTIKYRNGIIDIVTAIALDKKNPNYSYKINHARFTKEGEYNLGILSNYDIVSMSHIDADTSNVDIAKINLGDTIVRRGGHSTKVFQLAYHEDLNVFEVNVQMYQPDGKVNKDYEHRVDIVQIIKGE